MLILKGAVVSRSPTENLFNVEQGHGKHRSTFQGRSRVNFLLKDMPDGRTEMLYENADAYIYVTNKSCHGIKDHFSTT